MISSLQFRLRKILIFNKIGDYEALLEEVNIRNVNSVDEETGRTALHYAANYDLDDIVELLLTNKANVNALDKELNTPLHYASKHGI